MHPWTVKDCRRSTHHDSEPRVGTNTRKQMSNSASPSRHPQTSSPTPGAVGTSATGPKTRMPTAAFETTAAETNFLASLFLCLLCRLAVPNESCTAEIAARAEAAAAKATAAAPAAATRRQRRSRRQNQRIALQRRIPPPESCRKL